MCIFDHCMNSWYVAANVFNTKQECLQQILGIEIEKFNYYIHVKASTLNPCYEIKPIMANTQRDHITLNKITRLWHQFFYGIHKNPFFYE